MKVFSGWAISPSSSSFFLISLRYTKVLLSKSLFYHPIESNVTYSNCFLVPNVTPHTALALWAWVKRCWGWEVYNTADPISFETCALYRMVYSERTLYTAQSRDTYSVEAGRLCLNRMLGSHCQHTCASKIYFLTKRWRAGMNIFGSWNT